MQLASLFTSCSADLDSELFRIVIPVCFVDCLNVSVRNTAGHMEDT